MRIPTHILIEAFVRIQKAASILLPFLASMGFGVQARIVALGAVGVAILCHLGASIINNFH